MNDNSMYLTLPNANHAGDLPPFGLVHFGILLAHLAKARSTPSSNTSISLTVPPARVLNGRLSAPRIAPNAWCSKAIASGAYPAARRHREDLLQVERLARIDDVEDAVGRERAGPIAHGREVARRIEVAAIRLLHDHGVIWPSLFLNSSKKTHCAPLDSTSRPLARKSSTTRGQVVVVRALAPNVCWLKTDP